MRSRIVRILLSLALCAAAAVSAAHAASLRQQGAPVFFRTGIVPSGTGIDDKTQALPQTVILFSEQPGIWARMLGSIKVEIHPQIPGHQPSLLESAPPRLLRPGIRLRTGSRSTAVFRTVPRAPPA